MILPFHARGVPVQQVYGTTESGPVAIYQRRAEALRAPGAAGKAALHGELRVVDDGGRRARRRTRTARCCCAART